MEFKAEQPNTQVSLEEKPPVGAKYLLQVEDKKCYLKEIDRATYEMALGFAVPSSGQPQYIRAGEIILMKCWVAGDEEIKTSWEYLKDAAMQAYSLIETKEATIKKL